MWFVALKERGEFEGLREHFESNAEPRFRRVTTGTGGELLEAPEGSGWPHLALLSSDPSRMRAVSQWIHRNYHPRAIVSSGLITPLGDDESGDYFVPVRCLRSAGRIEVGGSPVLYEELSFDPEVQLHLRQTVLGTPPERPLQLFGADRELPDPELRRWLRANLHCQATDDFTAELLLIGKRFGTRIGCLRVFQTAKDPIRLLQESWTKLAQR